MNLVGDLGLLNMDSRTQDAHGRIRNTCEMVRQTKGLTVDVGLPAARTPDAKTYDLLNRRICFGVFQLEWRDARSLPQVSNRQRRAHHRVVDVIAGSDGSHSRIHQVRRPYGEVRMEHASVARGAHCAKETYGILIYQRSR